MWYEMLRFFPFPQSSPVPYLRDESHGEWSGGREVALTHTHTHALSVTMVEPEHAVLI